MYSIIKKLSANTIKYAVILFCITFASDAYAQTIEKLNNGLPANPWQGSGNTTSAKTIKKNGKSVAAPVYTGTSTTWNTAMGQDEIAPEVNVHNMLAMTKHLRALGYKIPTSVDTAIQNAPSKLRQKIMGSLQALKSNNGTDPGSNVVSQIMKDLERASGLSTENILGNSLDLLSGK